MASCTEKIAQENTEQPKGIVLVNQLTPEEYARYLITDFQVPGQTKAGDGDLVVIEMTEKSISIPNDELEEPLSGNAKDEIPIFYAKTRRGEKEGFTIASGDPRIPLVFAVVEEGQLSDTLFNAGLAILLRNIDHACMAYLNETTLRMQEAVITKTHYSGFADIDALYPTGIIDEIRQIGNDRLELRLQTRIYQNYSSAGPLITTEWGQRSPYNDSIPYVCGTGRAPTGCATIAVGQLLAYYKKPERLATFWTNYLSSPSNPTLIRQLSKELATLATSMNADYGCSNTGIYTTAAANTLTNAGLNCTLSGDVTTSTKTSKLSAGKPFYIRGTQSGASGGHAWIIDGYYKRNNNLKVTWHYEYYPTSGITNSNQIPDYYWTELRQFTPESVLNLPETFTYFHCNWGWLGDDNGWYAEQLFLRPTSQSSGFSNSVQTILIN
jgi:hypothetical protein